jgi:glycosyltransferase involved in cell wall biosynthesis
VEYGDVNELEKALLLLSVNPELRNELGRNGRLAYQQKFSWTIMKNRLISLYNIILR